MVQKLTFGPRKVIRSGPRGMITLPTKYSKHFVGKWVIVTIELVEENSGSKENKTS